MADEPNETRSAVRPATSARTTITSLSLARAMSTALPKATNLHWKPEFPACGAGRSTVAARRFLFWSGILFLCSLVRRQSLRDFPE